MEFYSLQDRDWKGLRCDHPGVVQVSSRCRKRVRNGSPISTLCLPRPARPVHQQKQQGREHFTSVSVRKARPASDRLRPARFSSQNAKHEKKGLCPPNTQMNADEEFLFRICVIRRVLRASLGGRERGRGSVPSMSTFSLPRPARSVHQQIRRRQNPFAEKNNARLLFMFLNSYFLIHTFWRACQEYILDKTDPDTPFDQCLQGFRV